MKYDYEIKSLLFGLAIGDALGVPVENKTKKYLKNYPITNYIEDNRPLGTYSDDSALSFCLAESLINGYDIEDIKEKMLKWFEKGYWSATGEAFGIGKLTKISLYDLSQGNEYTEEKYSIKANGNGSIMRIAPLIFHLKDKPANIRTDKILRVVMITHGHMISKLASIYYIEFLLQLIKNKNQKEAYKYMQENFPPAPVRDEYIDEFKHLLNEDIIDFSETEIKTSGYVIDTLEASIWCLLTTNNYKEAVLKAVNLGGDTDTIASITGALASLLYGFNNIPKEWVEKLKRNKDIEDLAIRFSNSL